MLGDYGLNSREAIRPMAKPTKEGAKRVEYNGYPLYLPDDETLGLFKEAYAEKTNTELTAITHRSASYNSRLGNYLGLKKSEAFMERRKNAARAKAKINHDKGKPQKGVIPEWLRPYMFGGEKANKRIDPTEHSEKMRKLWAAEKMREKYGLQRQTKLRLKKQ